MDDPSEFMKVIRLIGDRQTASEDQEDDLEKLLCAHDEWPELCWHCGGKDIEDES